MPDASAIDQYIQTAEIFDGFLDRSNYLACIAIIGLQCLNLAAPGYDFGNLCFGFFLAVHIRYDNCRAIFRQPLCNRCTDATTSARDEGNLSVQSLR